MNESLRVSLNFVFALVTTVAAYMALVTAVGLANGLDSVLRAGADAGLGELWMDVPRIQSATVQSAVAI